VATDRLVAPIAATGGAAVAFFLLGLAFRWPGGVAFAIAVAGAEYGVFLGFRGGSVDSRAPLVAAALFLAAEVGFRVLDPSSTAAEREVVARGAFWLVGGIVGTAVLGSLLLVAAGGATAGLWLEAIGIAAAVAALAVVVGAVSSSR
jgi:hypothetical protein